MRTFILTLMSILLAVTGAQAQADSQPPNVVIILVDDAALMDLGVYGGEAQTPNIDMSALRPIFAA